VTNPKDASKSWTPGKYEGKKTLNYHPFCSTFGHPFWGLLYWQSDVRRNDDDFQAWQSTTPSRLHWRSPQSANPTPSRHLPEIVVSMEF